MKLQNFIKNLTFLNYLYKFEKFRFLIYGFLNFLITNILLQILLLIIKISLATLIAQIINISLGYYLSKERIFKSNNSKIKTLTKYFILGVISWQFNLLSIRYISEALNISPNLSAIFIIPILTLWSYFIQKLIIFNY